MIMSDIIFKVPIIGLYFVFVPLLWCMAVNAANNAFMAEEWLHKVLYGFFCLAEIVCSITMIYVLYRVFINQEGL